MLILSSYLLRARSHRAQNEINPMSHIVLLNVAAQRSQLVDHVTSSDFTFP